MKLESLEALVRALNGGEGPLDDIEHLRWIVDEKERDG